MFHKSSNTMTNNTKESIFSWPAPIWLKPKFTINLNTFKTAFKL